MKRSAEEASLLVDFAADPCSNDANMESGDDARPHRVSTLSCFAAPPPSLVSSSHLSSSSLCSSATTISTTTMMHGTVSTMIDENLCDTPPNNNNAWTRFINARLLQRDGSLKMGALTVDSSTGIIIQIRFDSQPAEDYDHVLSDDDEDKLIIHTVDCRGMILSPGFIDLQLNGAYGVDFSGCVDDNDCTAAAGLCTDDIFQVANLLCQSGVTSFCPTMVSSSRETYRRVLPLIRRARREQQQHHQQNFDGNTFKIGANILGMHLEGPFFDPLKRGAHDERHILSPSKGIDTVREVYGLSQVQENENDRIDYSNPMLTDIDIITLAPELDGALNAIKSLTTHTSASDHNVVVSCGHTGATYEEGMQAVTHGATLLTHLFNAMNPFHHRFPGLVGLLSSETKLRQMGSQRPYFSLIVDGIHVHESAVCMAYNSHPDGCVLVTDAMSAMGLGDGIHALGNMSVSIKGDRATLAGTDTLAGSVVSMNTCVRRFQEFTGCSIGEALLCATLHPANVLNRSVMREREAPIGVLEVGARADLVLVTDKLDVAATWVHGLVAYDGLKIL